LGENFFATVVGVRFRDPEVTDAALEYLKRLTQLHNLDLDHTHVTDAGLENLTGLTQLQSLNLGSTSVDDAGLEHLRK
jgi:hypothetical protein